jgi:Male specific sperm protein
MCGRICVCGGQTVLKIIYGFGLVCGPICGMCGPICGLCGPVCGLCGPVCSIYYIKVKKTRLIYGIYHKKMKKNLKNL